MDAVLATIFDGVQAPLRRRGKRHHHGGDVCGWLCLGRQYFPYDSYCKNPTGGEFFVPARTLILIGVKLLT
jgi:hypothetical protein